MSKSQRGNNWCFTLNNYTEDEYNGIVRALEGGGISYGIVGKETGAEGTPHLQGYVQFGGQKRLRGVKKFLGTDRVHLEVARGTAVDNRQYCSKEKDFVEFGSPLERGQRTDLESAKGILDSGGSIGDIAEQHFGIFVRHHRALKEYQSVRRLGRREFRTQVCWFFGATGTGKSRTAHKEASYFSNGKYCSLGDTSLQWFDPYRDDKAVVIDDFNGTAKIDVLLRVWDYYPLQVPVKGGFVEWKPRIVYVTSNPSPYSLYGADRQFGPLCRRIDLLIEFDRFGGQTSCSGEEYFRDHNDE